MRVLDDNKYNYIMLFSLFLFSFSIGTSKAGINISIVLLFITFLTKIVSTLSSISNKEKTLIYICYGAYITEAAISLYLHTFNDFFRFLEKNAFLLILPILAILFHDIRIRKHAIIFFISGVTISALYSIYNFVFVYDYALSARALGLIEYSRHVNVLILLFCLMITSIKYKMYIIPASIVTLITIASVIISGTRGGWIAFFTTSIIFFLFHYKKYIIHALIISVVLELISFNANLSFSNYIIDRIYSISDIDETSNSIRLTIWRNGIEFLIHTADSKPLDFLFGSGMLSSSKNYINYINSLPENVKQSYLMNGNLYGSTDFHNSLIDIFIKSGAIYSIVIISIIIYILKTCWSVKNRNHMKDSICLYSIGLISIMPFYSLLQDYSIYTIIFALALAISEWNKGRDIIHES
ncbi:O-Antigen ligase [Vibrio ruber DSM 16370]|uniref:O-Antigen ligase n=1 Tax=Vibrio ruber (strain DSM 16370 / JCM 11486 / BCRC 17186 / CECT 7878 / LMG 23124 / VR1) TaxID=1123498 RepID=A0A1R4LL82_VIBR1|nr:O-antigen ligase family protein [Vibrio ruber]SJN57265.1 O-Antigen ligase [Vibrio ruber DSM 16370]